MNLSDTSAKYIALLWQIRRFIITGIVNTIFGYLAYVAGIKILQFDYTAALIFSYVVGVTFSYITFRTFVFEDHGTKKQSFSKFIGTYLFLFFLNWWALHFLVDTLHWDKLWAQILIVPCCAALSFIINKLFVFHQKHQETPKK